MNSLETTSSVLTSESRRGASMSEPRVIKKYPNRRLYDTVESRYITLADIRRLVVEKIDFVVIDKKSQDDITRAILLQVIAEQEHAGEPLMSQDFLSQVIRSYGGAMQSFVGSYLEQSLRLLSAQQQQMRDTMRGVVGDETYDAVATMTQQNLERWRLLQEEVLRTLGGAARNDERDVDSLGDDGRSDRPRF
jgi:polyhydroxyalkanoate synthesis repressor PhaR